MDGNVFSLKSTQFYDFITFICKGFKFHHSKFTYIFYPSFSPIHLADKTMVWSQVALYDNSL